MAGAKAPAVLFVVSSSGALRAPPDRVTYVFRLFCHPCP
jgi:hypothetical protein